MDNLNLKKDFDAFCKYLQTNNSICNTCFNEDSKKLMYDIIDNMIIKNTKTNLIFELSLLKNKGFDIHFAYLSKEYNKNNLLLNDHFISLKNKNILEWYLKYKNKYHTLMLISYDISSKNNKYNYYFITHDENTLSFCENLIEIYKLNDISNIITKQLKKCLPIINPAYIVRHNGRNVDTIRISYFWKYNKNQINDFIKKLKCIGYEYFTNKMLEIIKQCLNISSFVELQIDMNKDGTLSDIFSIGMFFEPNATQNIMQLHKILNEYNIFNKLTEDIIIKTNYFKKTIFDKNDIKFKQKYYLSILDNIKIKFKKSEIYDLKIYIDFCSIDSLS